MLQQMQCGGLQASIDNMQASTALKGPTPHRPSPSLTFCWAQVKEPGGATSVQDWPLLTEVLALADALPTEMVGSLAAPPLPGVSLVTSMGSAFSSGPEAARTCRR